MPRLITWFFILGMVALVAPRLIAAANISIDTVPVGNPGNFNDPNTGNVYGAVDHNYRIGTYEVTNSQYVAFLNAKAATNALGLFNSRMFTDRSGGIIQTGASGSYSYAVKPSMGNKPVNFVSWYDAIRFANWLNNGQGSGSTETGAYTIIGGTTSPPGGSSITRNAGATWFLPTESEWYKAALYQPATQGGPLYSYWAYATRSNSWPQIATSNSVGDIINPGANVANYDHGADWNSQNGNVTTVGSAGPLSRSFYGTYDQSGNVREYNETLLADIYRGGQGGSWASNSSDLGGKYLLAPVEESSVLGFRVATVPEPSTAELVLVAVGLIGAIRRRLG